MEISSLNNKQLHKSTVKAALAEKRATLILLDHLYLVNQRKMHLDHNCPTLAKYIVRMLGYSETEARVRIDAMRLVEMAPEIVRPAIESGEIPLSNASEIQKNIACENTSVEDIPKKIKDSIGKSVSELEKERKPQQTRVLILTEDLQAEIKRLAWGEYSDADIFRALLEEKIRRQKVCKSERPTTSEGTTRYIPVRVSEELLKRSGHKCEMPGCEVRHGLEEDHIIPFAHGGLSTLENLRLVCRAHNQRHAYDIFGALV